jgi:menaquinol-cytochrome c reductase cytochrome b/c subunit
MAEVPEHLLKRAAERKAALEAQKAAQGGGTPAAETPAAEPAAEAPASSAAEDTSGKIPAHLLARSQAARERSAGGGEGGGGGGTATATAPAPAAAAAARVTGAPAGGGAVGPAGHTQRLLTVVKSGSIQQTRADAQDKVHVWPHLLAIELAAILSLTAFITIFSALVKAPLLGLADVNATPNPSKAPWYFLGLQELLKMFHPMVAGVTIPGVALGVLAITPYVDKNPSNKPADRKFAIIMLTFFLMMWAVLVIIGSFFRGEGFNFVFPWNKGIFFEL